MALQFAIGASSASATEALSQTVDAILEVIVTSNDVLVKKECFKELANYLERVVPVLRELSKRNFDGSEGLNKTIEILSRETKSAKQLVLDCKKKSKVYLLLNCRSIVNRLEKTSREIGRALSLIPLAELDLSSNIVQEVKKISECMSRAEFRAAIAEEEIMEKIESGIQERNCDRAYANNLLVLIAEAVGISTEKSELRKEIEEFKSEIENARLRKDLAEAIQMDQLISLLERADVASSPNEKLMKYHSKRRSLGNQLVEPLQSFLCPITKDVMSDPVETSSGQTFDRCAIQKWIREGNALCPLTMTQIDPAVLRPNKTLRQSIEEWKDRNTMITIGTTRQKLLFEEDEEVINRLGELHELCEQRDQHREWVVLEDYIQVLIQLLGNKNREIRKLVLLILLILAKDSDDAKVRTLGVESGIESIIKSLGRRPEERKLAVALLLELSKCNRVRDHIGEVQGCILLLVTMSNNDDAQAASDARALLANLSYCDRNVILMAKANYFKHLLNFLSSGSECEKLNMSSSLAEMELTDHSKESLLEGGALGPLLDLISRDDVETKKVALGALRNLSTVPGNGLRMIREGTEQVLLGILFHQNGAFLSLNETVAAILMNLAAAVESQDANKTPVSFLESDEDILKLFVLVTLRGPDVQESIIRTFQILCQSQSSTKIKTKLIESSGFPVLIQLCENENPSVRANSVKLFCCLAEGSDEAIILEHISQKFAETVLRIFRSSNDDEERVSAMGIVSNLPETPQITKWLFDAGALPIISGVLTNTARQNSPHRDCLTGNAVGALCRFASSPEWQRQAAEDNIIPALVQLLETGPAPTKRRAAVALSRFSQSSRRLSKPAPNRRRLWCLSGPAEPGCPVHTGTCTVMSSFCLVEAGAVGPLVRILGEPDAGAREAALDALTSLIEGELIQGGSRVLAEANAIQAMIRLLEPSPPGLQEKALTALERIFRLVEFKQKYGAFAQMPLVDLTQRGSGSVKSMAARILAHLNLLHDQSSYF